jgi:hypothetical protein
MKEWLLTMVSAHIVEWKPPYIGGASFVWTEPQGYILSLLHFEYP